MLDRTVVAVLAGLAAAGIALIGAWLLVTAYAAIGWQIPFAAGFAVFAAIWFIDWLTDELGKRQQK